VTTYVNKHNQQFFPFVPELSSWEDWNGNFIIYYGKLNIPHTSEENWKDTASLIASTFTFSAFPIPDPDTFENWQDWANEVSLSINGKSH
jgi:hypothetical protein